jgi:hypothetical protein
MSIVKKVFKDSKFNEVLKKEELDACFKKILNYSIQ